MNIGINKKTEQIAAFEKGMIDIQELTGCKNVAEMLEAGWEWKYVPDEKWQSMLEELEDYEEPKVYYYVSDFGAIREGDVGKFVEDEIVRKEIGNYFEDKEEAEQAVEKLKAWKRLKDKGFKFEGFGEVTGYTNGIAIYAKLDNSGDYADDLDLLFGGEDE